MVIGIEHGAPASCDNNDVDAAVPQQLNEAPQAEIDDRREPLAASEVGDA